MEIDVLLLVGMDPDLMHFVVLIMCLLHNWFNWCVCVCAVPCDKEVSMVRAGAYHSVAIAGNHTLCNI